MHVIGQNENFVGKFISTVRELWDKNAVSDYGSAPVTYGELARIIQTNLLFWKAIGLSEGDKIAINSRSCASWVNLFFGSQIGGYVSVQIFPGFMPNDIDNLIEHCEAKIVYTEKHIFENLKVSSHKNVLAFIDCKSGELLSAEPEVSELYNNRAALFEMAYPQGLSPETLDWQPYPLDTVSAIMYTSGSTGSPKGVVLTNRNFTANIYCFPLHKLPFIKGDNYVSVLPYTHIFGLSFDMIATMCYGLHLVVLGLPPIPAYLKPALREFKPSFFLAVPLIFTKLIEDILGDFIHSKSGEEKLADHKNHSDYCEALATIFMKAMGGNIKLMATGGAAIPEHIESLFVEKLGVPFITGYGMTEGAPLLCVGMLGTYKVKECGEYIHEILDMKINSKHPSTIPGEILVKGHSIFGGYYKNEEATKKVFTEDGWFRTGDMATMDSDNSVFIVGRCKSMILSQNGQNIYPEEIEVKLNGLDGVAESLIVSRNDRLIALIVPDTEHVTDFNAEGLKNVMMANIAVLNKQIPSYCQVAGFELRFEPFAKTPKGSIKRYMYE